MNVVGPKLLCNLCNMYCLVRDTTWEKFDNSYGICEVGVLESGAHTVHF
jgi:hypothetical protein